MIHAALLPPVSAEAVSAIISGLLVRAVMAAYGALEYVEQARPWAAQRRTVVVTVEAHPVDVGVAGVKLGERTLAVAVDVRRPYPLHVGRPVLAENRDHVAPRGDVVRGSLSEGCRYQTMSRADSSRVRIE